MKTIQTPATGECDISLPICKTIIHITNGFFVQFLCCDSAGPEGRCGGGSALGIVGAGFLQGAVGGILKVSCGAVGIILIPDPAAVGFVAPEELPQPQSRAADRDSVRQRARRRREAGILEEILSMLFFLL